MVDSGGTAGGTTINAGGLETVAAGGHDFNDFVYGNQSIFGTASGSLIFAVGLQTVEAGGLAVAITVDGRF